jgi:hypothetical protein
MRIAYSLSCAAALAFLSVPSQSAENLFQLKDVAGKVMISTSKGLVPAEVGQVVADGARIFVGKDAIARVALEDGSCDIALPSQKITVINHRKLCDVNITPTASDEEGGGSSAAYAGIAFFAGVSGVAIIAMLDDDDTPMSTP